MSHYTKTYTSPAQLTYFLNIISPNNDMKAKVDALLSAYPSIDVSAMGFPRGWENEPLWHYPLFQSNSQRTYDTEQAL